MHQNSKHWNETKGLKHVDHECKVILKQKSMMCDMK